MATAATPGRSDEPRARRDSPTSHIVLCLHLKDGGVRLPLAVAVRSPGISCWTSYFCRRRSRSRRRKCVRMQRAR